MVCPLTPQKVCGSDERTYRNSCYLRRQRCISGGLLIKKYNGPCGRGMCKQTCPIVFRPICGDDGKTYASACMLKVTNCWYNKSVRKVQDGKCKSVGNYCTGSCSNARVEWCGSDGRTYRSECNFQRAKCDDKRKILTIVSQGPCKECKEACSYLYQPVCGTDGKTYSNKCLLSAVTCRNPEITIKHNGGCGTCMYQCSAKQEPLCGTDGKTYRNQCELDKFNCENKVGTVVSKKHIGACDPCAPRCRNERKLVCGSDKKTYHNACYLRRLTCQQGITNVYKLYDGQCHECGLECPNENNPICASNKKTYGNICEMQRESCLRKLNNVYKMYNGRCRRSCSLNCANTLQPVCATNGKTYRNYCLLKEAACKTGNTFQKKSNGYCSSTGHIGQGIECPTHCGQTSSYVCGTDGRTYKNDCFLSIRTCMTKGEVKKAYEGKCKKRQVDQCGEVQYPRYCMRKSYIYHYNRRSGTCRRTYTCKADGNSFPDQETCKKTCVKTCSKHCSRNYYPVCATNGKTFQNTCQLEIATCETNGSVKFSYNGVCGIQQN